MQHRESSGVVESKWMIKAQEHSLVRSHFCIREADDYRRTNYGAPGHSIL